MFHCFIGPQTYAEIYEFLTGYQVVESKNLPNRVCDGCENNLISFYNFRIGIKAVEQRISFYQKDDIELAPLEEVEQASLDNAADPILDGSEEYVVETIFEDEETLDENDETVDWAYTDVDETEPMNEDDTAEAEPTHLCRFSQSQKNPKQVKCKTCTDGCEFENTINQMDEGKQIEIICECDSTFESTKNFLKHYAATHRRSDAKYSCRECSESFNSWRSRIAHEAVIHSVGLKFQCSHCGKKFYRSDHWKEHEKSCRRIDTSEKFFSCSVCLFTFQREDTYRKHLETAHVDADLSDLKYIRKAEEFAQRYTKNRIALFMTDTEEASFDKSTANVCKTCQRSFKNEMSLNKHSQIFHSDQEWACDQCDAKFVHRSTKMSHMTKVHGAKKPFECPFEGCEVSCFKKDRFNAHMQKHLDPDKKYNCPICQQEFKSYNTMTLHRARHLTKNTITCPCCSRQFLDKRNYNVHMKLHTGEDLFHCPSCDRGFNRKDHLQKHQKRKLHYENQE